TRYTDASVTVDGAKVPVEVPEVAQAKAWLDSPTQPATLTPPEQGLPTAPMPGPKRALITSGVGVGVAAGLTYGAAWLLRSEYDANPTDGMYHATNGAFVGSIVLGTAATGLLVGGILTNDR